MTERLRRPRGRHLPTIAALLAALALGACQTDGNKPVATNSVASPNSIASSKPVAAKVPAGTKAIAFESIDGPPEPVFDRLVANLSSEATARQMPIVSREGQAAYRVRGYLAASVENGKGEVDWAWDVFDADRDRIMRISGVEKVGPGKDVWNKLDDAMLQRIAAQSIDEIATRLNGGTPSGTPAAAARQPDPADAPPVREDDGPAVADAAAAEEPGEAVAEAPATGAPANALTFAAHP
ncbi:hypothetical protein FO470_07130 [Starkeya sp. 3C]|uniref:Lipoprotein n=1 Tax=Ancylobacter moscoviensis TaxID=2597768 RepID=A0ABY3DRU7_9HYPH|nr:hypothetical protein [Ancylobacter moscoviensis]TSJ62770.1 hypothetical protein FO470_07130 [Ancylobacter moscoviensis]